MNIPVLYVHVWKNSFFLNFMYCIDRLNTTVKQLQGETKLLSEVVCEKKVKNDIFM